MLRGAHYLDDEVHRLHHANWRIDHRYNRGGFARRGPELDALIRHFRDQHGLALDWVYVAKAMLGLTSTIAAGEITPGSTVVFVVTGPVTTP